MSSLKKNALTSGGFSKQISIPLIAAIALGYMGCSKKKDSDDDEPADTATVSGGGSGTGSGSGVTANDGPSVAVAGELALGSLSLTGSQSVLLFKTFGGDMTGNPEEITVGGDGKFTATIAKADADVEVLSAQAALPREGRDWDAMAASVNRIMGRTYAGSDLQAMDESQIQEGVKGLADDLKAKGSVMLLVAYDKSGNKEAEASSFRFIGMPTAAGGKLTALVAGSIKGNLNLGVISGNGENPVSELAANSTAFDLSAGAIEAIAGMGDTLKSVRNKYMNEDYTAEPFFAWNQTPASGTGIAAATDQYSNANEMEYSGYGVYLFQAKNEDSAFSLDAICGSSPTTPIEFTPPSAVNLDNGGGAQSYTNFSSSGATLSTQGSNRICSGGDSFYAREDIRDGMTQLTMNFGAGGSIQDSPQGLWRMKAGGTEVGRFDLNSASPIKSGHSVVPVMSAKFITSGSNVVGVSVQFYRWNGSSYELMTDLKPIETLVDQVSGSVTRLSDNGEEYLDNLTKSADGTAFEGTFETPVATSDVGAMSASYKIGQSNYRIEFR